MHHLKFILTITCFSCLVSLWCLYSSSQVGNAQQTTPMSHDSVINTLVKDAASALSSGNTTKTLQNLNVVHRILLDSNKNSSSVMATELLINDAIEAVRGNDSSRAVVYLNLVRQQLGIQSQSPISPTEKQPSSLINSNSNSNSSFLTYSNPVSGVTMQYPNDWTVRQFEFNPEANNTLVGFYSPSKTASELGNISGVSGHFVPYSDIFVFDSKNMSLDKIIGIR